jgi:flagellar hook assembly protein FlgD
VNGQASNTNTSFSYDNPTVTGTPTFTPTVTNTPAVAEVPVLYPNPVMGSGPVSLQVVLQNPADSVDIKVFTIAFRKVTEQTESQVPAGVSTFAVDLKDKTGVPLANGLYYMVVKTPQGRTVLKLLILR